jgi:hypothetical protein
MFKSGRLKRSRRQSTPNNNRLNLEQLEARRLLAVVGYYDMAQGQGAPSQVQAIVAAGHTPVRIFDLSPQELSAIDVLDVQNPFNDSYGAEYLSRRTNIQDAVSSGMSLVIHDRNVAGANSILPRSDSFNIARDFSDARNIDVRDDTTLVTNGPGGIIGNATLDNGNSSNHGFTLSGSLPTDSAMILSTGNPNHIVTFAYGVGRGTVVYSSIPLDHYRNGATPAAFSQIYAPNVLAYAATNPLGVLDVLSTVPAKDSVAFIKPMEYIVNIRLPIDPATLDADDFQVNGKNATGVDYTVGTNSITFSFDTSPVTTQGLQTMHLAAGNFATATGKEVEEFLGSFRYDALLMKVASTAPADGSIVQLPFTTLDLNFNEAYDLGSADLSDFVLSRGTLSAISPVDADTLRLTLHGIESEGTLTVEMAAGAMTDLFGNPGAAFSASYALDFGVFPYPVPFTPNRPLGSLIYDSAISGTISEVDDTDSFTVKIDAGQMLTLVVDSEPGLRSKVEVRDQSGNLLGSAAAAANGDSVVLQTVPTHGQLGHIVPKTYTVTVAGADGSLGGYNLKLILNAAVEQESYGGASNGSLATAQSLEPAFLPLHGSIVDNAQGRPMRAAVIGQLEDLTLTPFFEEDFETDAHGFTVQNAATGGYLVGLWHLSTGRGDEPGHSASRSFYYGQDEGPDGGGSYRSGSMTPSRGTITSPPIALPADGTLVVDFNHVLDTRRFVSDVDFASLQINDGSGWSELQRYDGVAESSTWTTTDPVSLTAYAGKTVQLRWSFDTLRGPVGQRPEGWYVDDIRVSQAALDDYYSLQMQAGESLTVTLKKLSGSNANLRLIGPDGRELALGAPGAANVDMVISNFLTTTPGTYYLRVTGVPGTAYSLVATRNADFDTEDNSGISTAQQLLSSTAAGRHWALGAIKGGGTESDDFETGGLSSLPWITYGNATWSVTDATANSGKFSARAGSIGDFQSSHLEVTLLTQAGNVEFARRVYSEGGYDFLQFYIDDALVGVWSGIESTFTQQSFPVSAGTHTFKWSYIKDGSVSVGLDTVFIDDITIPGISDLSDFYKIDVEGNRTVEIQTITPARTEGQFVNHLDPMVRLYDASGQLVASDDNSDSDGHNASLRYRVPRGAGGAYYVEVTSSAATAEPTTGEYLLSVKGDSGKLPAFRVANTSIPQGSRMRGPIAQVTVDFNDTILLTSLHASDLTVNGVPATGFTVVDFNTVTFDLPSLSEGLQNVQFAGGAVVDVQGTPIDSFSLTFYHDNNSPRIAASSITAGEVIPINGSTSALSYTVVFSEPMKTANLDNSDFRLLGANGNNYTPISASYDPTGTVLTLNYEELTEGAYTLSLFSGNGRFEDTAQPDGRNLDGEFTGTLPSGDGVEGGNFVINFSLDIRTAAFPTPFNRLSPAGSMIYNNSAGGSVQFGGDTDSFTVTLDAGQTITVLVNPLTGSLLPTGELRDPSNAVVGTATAGGVGQNAVIQTVATVAGTYTIVVGGNGGTTGQYSLQLTLNAALENESHYGASNDTLQTAQNIEGSFVNLLKGADRGAVLGKLDGSADVYAFSMEAGKSVTVGLHLSSMPDSFVNRVDYSVGSSPYAVEYGDLNNDGYADMVTANYNGWNATVRFNNGDGSFGAPLTVGTGTQSPSDLALGDVNGDGNLDIVLTSRYGNPSAGSVTVLLANGNGGFGAPVRSYLGYDTPHIAVGDFDGDGHLDVAQTAYGGGVIIGFGNGTGGFADPRFIQTGGSTWDVAVADLNGDSLPDLIVVPFIQGNSYHLTTLLSNGNRTFGNLAGYYHHPSRGLAVGDVNGDGAPDVVATNYNGGVTVRLNTNDGTGSLGAAKSFVTSGGVHAVALGDVNGDGNVDLAISNEFNPGGASVLFGAGGGAFGAPTLYSGPTGQGTRGSNDVALVDLNNDGRADLSTPNRGTHNVSVWLAMPALALELLDPNGEVVATETLGTNLDLIVYNYTATASGTYYVRTPSVSGPNYSLVVTRDATFDREPNDSFHTAQNFDGVVGSLGYVGSLFDESAFDTTAPGDAITPTSYNSPSNEGVWNAIDNNPATKYLNFDKLNTGFVVVPSSGLSLVEGISLTSANDFPERDPASYTLEGSNNGVDFVLVSSGIIPAFTARHQSQTITFTNNMPYLYYRLLFPTVANAFAANSMQIAEVELLMAAGDPEDWYSVTLEAGTPYSFPIITPGDGAGEFVNTLDPKIELFDPSGNLLDSDDGVIKIIDADGRNETLYFTPNTSGLYRIRVTAENGTTGEYFLDPLISSKPSEQPVDQLANRENPNDVNGNGRVEPLDALLIINAIRRGISSTANGPATGAMTAREAAFLDTNGDGRITPLDVLQVINAISRRGQSGLQAAPATPAVTPASYAAAVDLAFKDDQEDDDPRGVEERRLSRSLGVSLG